MVVQLFVDGVRNRELGLVSSSKERYAAPITERAMEDSRSWFQRALPPAETTKHHSAFQRIKDGRSCVGTAERFKTTEPVFQKEHDARGPYTKHVFKSVGTKGMQEVLAARTSTAHRSTPVGEVCRPG